MQDEYTLTASDDTLGAAPRAAMGAWLREQLPVPSIEVDGDLWYLFADEVQRGAAARWLAADPDAVFYAYATIRLRPTHVQLATVRDPVTDRALHAFVLWCQRRAPLTLLDGGMPIEAAEIIDPELYE